MSALTEIHDAEAKIALVKQQLRSACDTAQTYAEANTRILDEIEEARKARLLELANRHDAEQAEINALFDMLMEKVVNSAGVCSKIAEALSGAIETDEETPIEQDQNPLPVEAAEDN